MLERHRVLIGDGVAEQNQVEHCVKTSRDLSYFLDQTTSNYCDPQNKHVFYRLMATNGTATEFAGGSDRRRREIWLRITVWHLFCNVL